MPRKGWYFAGLFLVCMCALMMQIVQTRILSVVSVYYLAFLSISMAMLGMTAGALLAYFRFNDVTPERVTGHLAKLSTAFALTTAVCFVIQLASPMPFVRAATMIVLWIKVLFLLAAPFTVAGLAISLALTRSPFPIGITYGVDLAGAAAGCLAILLLLETVDTPSAMLFVAALAAVGGVCFHMADTASSEHDKGGSWRVLRYSSVVALSLFALAIANSATRQGLQLISARFNTIHVGADAEFEKWNSFSRVLVRWNAMQPVFLWGPSPTMPAGLMAEQRQLNIDGFAGTTMPKFTGDTASVNFLKYDISNLAYAIRPTARVAVVGVGSGRDLLSAHIFGARDITGVELNGAFVELLTDHRKLRNYAGIADIPGVRLLVDEGRSWFARTQEKFDLIQMSMIDTFAATGAGAFSLSENGLYTLEGWRIFFAALTPKGLFSVSRWHSEAAPIEIGRVVSLASSALFSLGADDPSKHVFLASVGNLATLIVSREPLSPVDLAGLNRAATQLQFKILASPDQTPADPIFQDLLTAKNVRDLNARAERYWLDVSAPTDSRPFFFNQLRIANLLNLRESIDHYRSSGSYVKRANFIVVGNFVAIGTLLLLIVLSLIAVVFTILLPAWSSVHNVDRDLIRFGSAYFLLIGLGFMFVEIGFLQRMSVFMGHPIYALSIVLFIIILSTGIGSFLSEKIPLTTPAQITAWLGALVAYVFALPFWLPAVTGSAAAGGIVVRALVCVAAVLPAGILMGFAFPLGMKLVTKLDTRPAPWFWGLNGAGGVLAAGSAVACSISTSVDTTLRIGGFFYLLLVPVALALMGNLGSGAAARQRALTTS